MDTTREGVKMKKILLITVILFLAACSYIINTDKQDVGVRSEPTGAKIVVKTTGGVEVFSGQAPASIKLKKKNEYVVYVSLEGYKDEEVRIDKRIEPWVIGNLLCGGIPGLVVDGITGAMWKLEPDEIVVTLQVASTNRREDRLFVLISWLDEDINDIVNIPIALQKI